MRPDGASVRVHRVHDEVDAVRRVVADRGLRLPVVVVGQEHLGANDLAGEIDAHGVNVVAGLDAAANLMPGDQALRLRAGAGRGRAHFGPAAARRRIDHEVARRECRRAARRELHEAAPHLAERGIRAGVDPRDEESAERGAVGRARQLRERVRLGNLEQRRTQQRAVALDEAAVDVPAVVRGRARHEQIDVVGRIVGDVGHFAADADRAAGVEALTEPRGARVCERWQQRRDHERNQHTQRTTSILQGHVGKLRSSSGPISRIGTDGRTR